MEWFLLESLVALVIALAIVWWTMRPSKPRHTSGDPAVRNAQPTKPDDDA